MHAGVRRYTGTEVADTLAARRDEVLSVIRGAPGFRAYYLIRTDSETISITVCDDATGVDESNEIARTWLQENMPDLSASPERSAGEVVASTTG